MIAGRPDGRVEPAGAPVDDVGIGGDDLQGVGDAVLCGRIVLDQAVGGERPEPGAERGAGHLQLELGQGRLPSVDRLVRLTGIQFFFGSS